MQKIGAKVDGINFEIHNFELKLYQVLPGSSLRIWVVKTAWGCDSDIVVLHLALDSTGGPDKELIWRTPRIRLYPPSAGQTVFAFGYREGKFEVNVDVDGTHHVALQSKGTTSTGKVGQIFPQRRDSSMLTFPCFELCAQVFPGMSGGLVVDQNGAVCGLISSGFEMSEQDSPPMSYAATLWPILKTIISADRGDSYPRGIEYPMIELVLGGQIKAIGVEEVDTSPFPNHLLL